MSNSSGGDLFLGHGDDLQPGSTRAVAATASSFASLSAALRDATAGFDPRRRLEVDRLSAVLMHWGRDEDDEERCSLLSKTCFYYQRVGCSFDGIPRGRAARDLAYRRGFTNQERRACNVLGTVYLDSANFEDACKSLERSLHLAREIGDPFLISVAYTTTGALFKEMGCYVDAMAVVDRSLEPSILTAEGEHIRFTSATNGLFCAHRLHDEEAALRYMTVAAAAYHNPLIDAVTRAAFEFNRAVYLLSHDDAETAEMLIDAALVRDTEQRNPRVDILLRCAAALCDWASRKPQREARARESLRELHHRSRQTNLYHDDVLRALMTVHSRPSSREEFDVGVAYAKELVEYITSVKHAKFYRQMSDHGVPVLTTDVVDPGEAIAPRGPLRDAFAFDPFANARRWLAEDQSVGTGGGDGPDSAGRSRDIHVHDELTAIHDDLATMRTASLKSSIRTVAYAMAENWAVAAEFFDDQTGQHCFRVGRLAGMLAAELGMSDDYCVRIEHAARLHDIGKITVNELILLKPGPLGPGELTAMRAHAEVGGFLLQFSTDPTLQMAAVIARHHHEWWNGTGYPHGLSGERIPLEARICAMADVYDALTNARPYKRAWPHRAAVEQMMCEAGVHFDPRLMTPFLQVLERHAGSTAQPPSTQLYLQDMDANGLLASRRRLMETINGR